MKNPFIGGRSPPGKIANLGVFLKKNIFILVGLGSETMTVTKNFQAVTVTKKFRAVTVTVTVTKKFSGGDGDGD